MYNKEDSMMRQLEQAKGELQQRQENIRRYADHDMHTSGFEKNMITELLLMIELKEKIKTLELSLQL